MSRRNIYFILGKSQRVPIGDAKGGVPYEKVLSTASLCRGNKDTIAGIHGGSALLWKVESNGPFV